MQKPKIGSLLFTISVKNILGENVLWHTEMSAIYWLDIEAACLFRYQIFTHKIEKFSLPYRMASFAFSNKKDHIIAAFEHGIAEYNIESTKIHWIFKNNKPVQGNRFNDGRSDHQGRFWAGTMVEQRNSPEQHAKLYCIDHNLKCSTKIDHLTISNGLCWSKDGETLYHADSTEHTIFQYDFCKITGNIKNKKVFAKTSLDAFPDGSTVDEQNYLWNAQWGSGEIIRYDRFGQINLKLKLPVSNPSCVAIGGVALDWLIITTAKHNLSEKASANEPLAGDVFVYQLHNIKGLVEPKCTLMI